MKRHQVCIALVAAVLLGLWTSAARAQFTTNPTDLPTLPTPRARQTGNTPTPEQLRDLYMLRYLQGRRSGGVRTGVPQFIPFGNPFGFSGVPGMGTYQNQNAGGGGNQFQGQGQGLAGQGGGAQNAVDPAADPNAQAQGVPQTPAEKRAAAKAAREERTRLAREKNLKRKEEAAAKAKAKAEARKAQAGAKDPAAAP